jgi:hypothetical protein
MEEVPPIGHIGKAFEYIGSNVDAISQSIAYVDTRGDIEPQVRMAAILAARQALDKEDARFRFPAITLLGALRDADSATQIEKLKPWASSFEPNDLREQMLRVIDLALKRIRGETT